MQGLPLSQLNQQISNTLTNAFSSPLWIIAEVAKVGQNSGKYTYLELVEKRGNNVLAKATAKFPSSNARILTAFESETGTTLCQGMKILFRAQVAFHIAYGLSLDLLEIDPTYSLGDMERRRREILNRLTTEGIIEKNKRLSLPHVTQRVAIISSEQAAGLGDFLYRLTNNQYNFTFNTCLFPATVQGPGAESSTGRALRMIAEQSHHFDCIMLIRGGGAVVDLSCFDSYSLAHAIAHSPLPVICGIGHQKDNSVCDTVAAYSVATPTAAAEFLIDWLKSFDESLGQLARRIEGRVRKILQEDNDGLVKLSNNFTVAARREISQKQDQLGTVAQRTFKAAKSCIDMHGTTLTKIATLLQIQPSLLLNQEMNLLATTERDLLRLIRQTLEKQEDVLIDIEKDVRQMDPAQILRRGFSITRIAGRAIRDLSEVTSGTPIETIVSGGRLNSIISGVQSCPKE